MQLLIKKKAINEILISAFVGICVVFPEDIYCLKKILFIIIILLNLRLILNSLIDKKNSLISFFGLIFPTILILYSSLLTGDLWVSFVRSFAAYLILIVFVIRYYNIDYEKILVKSISLIVFLTLLLVLMDLLKVIDVNTGFFRNNIMYGYGVGLMGKSPDYPFYYKIFFRTSPLIVILLFKSFDKGNYITTFVALAALIFSGTRANVIFPIFFLTYFYIFCSENKSRIIKFAFIFVSIIFIVTFSSSLFDMFYDTFIVKGQISDIVRRGHIEGICEHVKNDPWIIIRGSGMGSYFYSYGINSLTNSIEWSYIDLWRQMGFVFFSLFIIFITVPLFYTNGVDRYKKYAYVSYLFIAATNPLLYSSTAYLFYIYMYYNMQKNKMGVDQG